MKKERIDANVDNSRNCLYRNLRYQNRSHFEQTRAPRAEEKNTDRCEYPSLAMVYMPFQEWTELYGYKAALCNGTLFKQLNNPFLAGNRGGRAGC